MKISFINSRFVTAWLFSVIFLGILCTTSRSEGNDQPGVILLHCSRITPPPQSGIYGKLIEISFDPASMKLDERILTNSGSLELRYINGKSEEIETRLTQVVSIFDFVSEDNLLLRFGRAVSLNDGSRYEDGSRIERKTGLMTDGGSEFQCSKDAGPGVF